MGIQGIIRPPPEIRAVADKTASFVAKNGRAFETRIVNSAKGKTPKFAFLHENSPFHAYYEDKILFYQNGGVDDEKVETSNASGEQNTTDVKDEKNPLGDSTVEDTGKGVSRSAEVVASRQVKSHLDPVAKALLTQRMKVQEAMEDRHKLPSSLKDTTAAEDDSSRNDTEVEENQSNQLSDELKLKEPSYLFTRLIAPHNISAVQLEIIKTTAQFVVLNGKGGSFLRDVTLKEWNNPIFEFLQPRHAYYAYFSQLVDVYRNLLQISVITLDQESTEKRNMKENDENSSASKKELGLLEIANLKKMAGLDYVGTQYPSTLEQRIELISKTAGNIQQCLEYITFCCEYNRYFEEQKRDQESKDIDGQLHGAAFIDWHDFVVVETIEFAVDESVKILKPKVSPASDQEEGMMEESDDENINVVSDYQPKVISSQAKLLSESRTHVIDPITGKSIPIEDMSEHMRIQLLDPKWATEKAKFMESQKESNLVRGDLIAKNINALLGPSAAHSNFLTSEGDQSSTNYSHMLHQNPSVQAPFTHQIVPTPPSSQVDIPASKRARTENYLPQQPQLSSFPLPIDHRTVITVDDTETGHSMDAIDHTTDVSKVLLPEEEFLKSLQQRTFKLFILLPRDASNSSWNLNGQTISIDVDVMSSVKAVKEDLQTQLGGMPVSKIQLKSTGVGFLKDSLSLAYLNIGPESYLELVPKVRGGRR